MVVRQLGAAIGRGSIGRAVTQRVIPDSLRNFFPANPVSSATLRATPRTPVVPPNTTELPVVHQKLLKDYVDGKRPLGPVVAQPPAFGSGPRRMSAGVPRPGEDIAAIRAAFTARAKASPPSSVSMGGQPKSLEAQIANERAVSAGLSGGPAKSAEANLTRRAMSNVINDGEATSLELAVWLPSAARNQAEFGRAIQRVRLLVLDPKITPEQRSQVYDRVVDIAQNRFAINTSDEIMTLLGQTTQSPLGAPGLKLASQTLKTYLNNATTPEQLTDIYAFALRINTLSAAKTRTQFLIDFEKAIDKVGRGEVRRLLDTGIELGDDVASVVWSRVSGGGLRGVDILLQTAKTPSGATIIRTTAPKTNDYANAIRTSYSRRELDDVGNYLKEQASDLSPADYELLSGMYVKQQELIFSNAFNRIQRWLASEQGGGLKLLSQEVYRLKELPPGARIVFPEKMRSRSKGVRKATDPSNSPITEGTGGSSFRGLEGELGISQLRSQALNTADMHQSYVTRAAMRAQAKKDTSIFTRAVSSGDDVLGVEISNVTFAEAGLRQPYTVGQAHSGVTVRMVTSGRVKDMSPRKGENVDKFMKRINNQKANPKQPESNVLTLSPDRSVDRVFEKNLLDDLTLMGRPNEDFIVRNADGLVAGELARSRFTHVAEGLPNNLTVEQAKQFIKTLDMRDLQRAEMQHYVDRYGYRLLYDVQYVRTLGELTVLSNKAGAAFASGMSPKGWHEIIKQAMSQRAAMINVNKYGTGTVGRGSGSRRKKNFDPPFRFTGKTSFEDFMEHLSGNIPSPGAARLQGGPSIQFPS